MSTQSSPRSDGLGPGFSPRRLVGCASAHPGRVLAIVEVRAAAAAPAVTRFDAPATPQADANARRGYRRR